MTIRTDRRGRRRRDRGTERESGTAKIRCVAVEAFSSVTLVFYPRVARRVTLELARACRENGLALVTTQQAFTLLVLKRNGDGTLKALAAAVSESSSSVSSMIQRLVEKDLVARVEDPRDRRRVIITLLPEGARLASALDRAIQKALEGLCSCLDTSEAGRLEAICRVLLLSAKPDPAERLGETGDDAARGDTSIRLVAQ